MECRHSTAILLLEVTTVTTTAIIIIAYHDHLDHCVHDIIFVIILMKVIIIINM